MVDSRRLPAIKTHDQAGFAMYRFGAFQVEPRTHELRRSGVRIKIQEQSFVVLLKLLEQSGRVVPANSSVLRCGLPTPLLTSTLA